MEVVVVGWSQQKLRAAERSLAASSSVTTIATDMAQEVHVAHLFVEAGAFDHLVSTAGTPPPGDPTGCSDVEAVRRFIESKLVGAFVVAKHASRSLKAGGSMTFTSGISKNKPPVRGGAALSTVAGSFSHFARALSLELAPTRVNVVSPGWIDTPMFDELAGEAKSGLFERAAAAAGRQDNDTRGHRPAYIYAMESDFMTVQTIHIDGGQSLI